MNENTTMRAKVRVSQVVRNDGNEQLTFNAVCGSTGANGSSEDNTFARYTPNATFSLTVNNPDLIGKFNPGDVFYVDFIQVPKTAPNAA